MTKGLLVVISTSLITYRLCRFDPGCPPCRVNRCQQAHHHSGTADNGHILPLQLGRQVADEVDVGTQELVPHQPLKPGNESADIQGSEDSERGSHQGAKDTYYSALNDENSHNAPGCRPHGSQNRDVCGFVGDYHDQGGNNIESGHGHNEHQQQANHGLFHPDSLEQVSVSTGPVRYVVTPSQILRNLVDHARCCKQIIHQQAHALGTAAGSHQAGRIIHMNQRIVAIQLGTDTEYAFDGKSFESRHYAGRGYRGFRQDNRQFVSDLEPEAVGHQPTDDNAEFSRLEFIQVAFNEVILNDRYRGFLLGHNAA